VYWNFPEANMRLECINPDRNMFRFYEIRVEPTLFDEHALLICWGRIGKRGRQRIALTGNFAEVQKTAEKLEKTKVKRGYFAV